MSRRGYTLVTCLGAGSGIKSDKGGYKTTKYRFQNNMEYESALFFEALLQHYGSKIKKVVIVGTNTSSWHALIADIATSNDEMMQIYNEVEECSLSKGVNDELLGKIEACLSSQYSRKFKLIAHDSSLDSDNFDNIQRVYSGLNNYIDSDTKLVLDVTNGFRYMPMLMFQNLQLQDWATGFDDVDILYGELSNGVSEVRNISSLWKLAEINKQIFAFESTYEGAVLGDTFFNSGYKQMGMFILDFSNMIKRNYVMQIGVLLSELNKVLEHNKNIEEKPYYFQKVYGILLDFQKKFSSCTCLSEKLLCFSEILNEKGLTTQAIISLRESIAIRLLEKHEPGKIGQYVELNGYNGPHYYMAFIDNCKNFGLEKDIRELFTARNRIAHAGTEFYDKDLRTERISYKKMHDAVERSWSLI